MLTSCFSIIQKCVIIKAFYINQNHKHIYWRKRVLYISYLLDPYFLFPGYDK